MRKLPLLLFLLLMGGWPAFAQQITGSITAVDTSTVCTTANSYVSTTLLSSAGAVSFVVSGTYSGTLSFWVSVDGTHLQAVTAYPPNSTTGVTTTTGTGTWTVGVPGMRYFCVDASSYVSGTAVVTLSPSPAVSVSTLTAGGSGGDGVTSVTGAGTNTCSPTTGAVVCTGTGIGGSATVGYEPVMVTNTTTITTSPCDHGVTTANQMTCSDSAGASFKAVKVPGDGTHTGVTDMAGNTAQSLVQDANSFGLYGPNSASFTCWGFQPQATYPASAGVLLAGVAAAVPSGTNGCYASALTVGTVTGSLMANNTVTATQLAAQYSKGSCTEIWGGSGTSFALQSGDDAISNNSCYNDSGVTRTITAVKCRSDNSSNTTTVNPTFGSAGTGTTILSGALTCGNSYAYSATGTVSSASWTTGSGIDPAMGGTLTGTSIAMIVEYTY